jgi:toxin ParE1/3/4
VIRFRVIIEPDAELDILGIRDWIALQSPDAAAMWVESIRKAILSLQHMPRRFPLAPEDDSFLHDIRQMVCGRYRVLFTVSGSAVHVLHVRHASRRPWRPEDN